jgi:tRNASer (uridine44-2'-O)-methyltransferase
VEPYSHNAQFRLGHFFAALKDLSVHPERNSSLILRADPIDPPSSISTDEADDEEKHELENVLSSHLELGLGAEYGLQRVEELWNKLIPKQVSRDGKLNQRVIMYKRVKKSTTPQGMDEVDQKKQEEEGNTASVKRSTEEEDEREFGVVLMIPQVSTPEDIPFYHPSVQKIAFVYQPLPLPSTTSTKAAAVELPPTPTSEHPPSSADSAEPVKPVARLSIAYLPFPSRQSETDSSSTLSPTTKQVSIDGVDPRDTHTETMPAALPGNPVISGSLSIRQVRSPRKRSPLAAPPVGEDGTVSQEAQDAEIKPPATIMESELNGRDVPVILDHIGQNDGHHGGLGLSGATSPGEQSSTEPEVDPQEEAEAKAQAEQSAKKAKQASERTDRTCLALLERVYKQSYGDMTGYQKRMHHDVSGSEGSDDEGGGWVVDREE